MRKVWAAFFSPTGNAAKICRCFGRMLAESLDCELEEVDFTLPQARTEVMTFEEDDYLVMAVPVYAGRIPNKILPWIQTGWQGNGARATALVTFGNRNCDSALGELKLELENNGFRVISAAALVSEHVFSSQLATGRPDADDLEALGRFARSSGELINRQTMLDLGERAGVNPYYTPRRVDGEPAKFLKAKPLTDMNKCIRCGLCAAGCPMGSISREDTSLVEGICIKCQACIKKCPVGAKYIDQVDFLSHRDMLVANFTRHADNEFYL